MAIFRPAPRLPVNNTTVSSVTLDTVWRAVEAVERAAERDRAREAARMFHKEHSRETPARGSGIVVVQQRRNSGCRTLTT